ncbi:MAG: hypoxanthine phosphoribosyltransferase [Bryobacterales bacterium]|nr:hypoxanthine phosphoribosyltransferase [Bryobacterales bacterium]
MSTDALEVLISAERIARRVKELGKQIDADYPVGETLLLVGVLKGAWVFLADLCRAISRPVQIDFLSTSSYGSERTSSGEVKLMRDLDESIEGKHVLVVEDIVDTGVTLSYLLRVLGQRRPASLRIATFLDKPSRRKQPVEIAYCGFEVPDKFVVGYGLDFASNYRNLPELCAFDAGDPGVGDVEIREEGQ